MARPPCLSIVIVIGYGNEPGEVKLFADDVASEELVEEDLDVALADDADAKQLDPAEQIDRDDRGRPAGDDIVGQRTGMASTTRRQNVRLTGRCRDVCDDHSWQAAKQVGENKRCASF